MVALPVLESSPQISKRQTLPTEPPATVALIDAARVFCVGINTPDEGGLWWIAVFPQPGCFGVTPIAVLRTLIDCTARDCEQIAGRKYTQR